MKISVCILTKNAEKTIKKTLESVRVFDEIVVVDDFSTDKTLNIAKKFKVKIYKHRLDNDFAAQRNFALSKITNTRCLFLDSDEYLSDKLVNEIKNLNVNPDIDGYKITRKEIWKKRELKGGEWGNIKLTRLGKKNYKWKRSVHEYWDIENVSELKNAIFHEPNNSISDFIGKLNKYSQIHARENAKENKKSTLFDVVFKPIFKFTYNFFVKSGYKDATHGFVYAVLMSFHSFLSWSNLWTKEKK